jgi:hypothetical protein
MKTKLRSIAVIAMVLFSSVQVCAQTPGTMSFNFTTVQQGTKTKQVMAVWIENATGTFIKTNLLYIGSGSTDDHVPQFSLKSGATAASTVGNGAVNDATTGNIINAITGATRSATSTPKAWAAYSVSWDGKTGATTPALVADATYKVWIEMAWNDNPDLHDFINTGYSFVKGASLVTSNPANIGPLSTMTVTWTPSALSLDSVYKTKVAIYPNPSNGVINVQYNDVPVSKINVVNILGQVVKSVKVNAANSETSKSIDMSGEANGIYIVNVATDQTSSNYKVVLDK